MLESVQESYAKQSKIEWDAPYVTLAHVGRVAGQSKQTRLAEPPPPPPPLPLPALMIFRNCRFFSADGRQTWPLPAAV